MGAFQPRTQASSRNPSYQRRLGTECDSANSTSLTGDVTSEIAEDDWERGWVPLTFAIVKVYERVGKYRNVGL